MAAANTLKVQDGKGFKIIAQEDYDESVHKLVVGEDEIIVKPLNVEGAKPFIIGEKDFDPNSYEKVNATKANVAEVAKQTDRQTLHEAVEEKSFNSVEDNELTREYAKNNESVKSGEPIKSEAKTPQKKENQKRK